MIMKIVEVKVLVRADGSSTNRTAQKLNLQLPVTPFKCKLIPPSLTNV
jgi:hypothetical protein